MQEKCKALLTPVRKSNILLKEDGTIVRVKDEIISKQARHIYITSDDPIEVNNYIRWHVAEFGSTFVEEVTEQLYDSHTKGGSNYLSNQGAKVIASTDESLELPGLSEKFIDVFIKNYKNICEINVEYVDWFWFDPPSGWQYGFPKLIQGSERVNSKELAVKLGYPKNVADEYQSHFPCKYSGPVWLPKVNKNSNITIRPIKSKKYSQKELDVIVAKEISALRNKLQKYLSVNILDKVFNNYENE